MSKKIRVVLIDGYIDDPAALGVPPYISPMIRAIAGAAVDAGANVDYITIDMIRKGKKIPDADVSVVLSGNTVPGKYLRSMPMSVKELENLVPSLSGWKLVGGSAASSSAAELFDFVIYKDLAASLYDGMCGKEVNERYRTLDEWNRWMILGAEIVTSHPDFPQPLVAEIETFRGCHRWSTGGCSYCIEAMKGKPLIRAPSDIIEEATKLKELGVKNLRVGGQTCIISYGSEDENPTPEPNVDAVRELFEGLHALDFDVLHVDNANAAVIAEYPEKAEEILKILTENCTAGNVLALGMESADIKVVNSNNLNSTPEQIMTAVEMINRIGGKIGDNGMPLLLPGLNFISGLDGETKETYNMNLDFLKSLLEKNLIVRRINIRQVLPIRKEFNVRVDQNAFKNFKKTVREEIDGEMLRRMVPWGTVLKNVYLELNDGNMTFGRQIGSYPLLIGVPCRMDIEKFVDLKIVDWGFRSITGMEYPFPINSASMTSIASLPGIGKKRAATIVRNRPYANKDELMAVLPDMPTDSKLLELIGFD